MANEADEKVMPLRSDEDVVRLRQLVREQMVAAGFSLIDQTKMVTASSELARNTLRYGGGGQARMVQLSNGARRGLALEFSDQGPGIPDIDLALKDGYTTGGGMGLGLSGAKRLSDEFEIESAPGAGTLVKIRKWKPF